MCHLWGNSRTRVAQTLLTIILCFQNSILAAHQKLIASQKSTVKVERHITITHVLFYMFVSFKWIGTA